jgi:hypothetical protein
LPAPMNPIDIVAASNSQSMRGFVLLSFRSRPVW